MMVVGALAVITMSTLGGLVASQPLQHSPVAAEATRQTRHVLASKTASPSGSPSPSPSATAAAATVAAKAKAAKKITTPSATPAGATNKFGLSVGNTLPGLSAAELAKRLDDFKALGVSWIRLDLDWSDIQPENAATYEWERWDAVVTAANARGLKLLPIITYTAPWARLSACASELKCAPANAAQFATFSGVAVSRYAPRGIHHWEIWNEENTDGAWMPSPSASAYTELLKATYPRIKQADASSVVILGGLASSSQADGIPQLDFLTDMYAAGAKAYFDAVAYHPYSFPVPASYNVEWNAWTMMSLTPRSLRSIMAANGDGAKQVWVTEYGAPTNGPGPAATPTDYKIDGSPDHVTEALQAAIVTDFIATSKSYPWLAASFWYSYQDEGTAVGDVENFFGLLRADSSRKPAYDAFVRAIRN